MTQICVFNMRLFSLHNTLNYAIHGACLRMVLLTDVYRNLTSIWIKPRECGFKQFKSPVLNVLKASSVYFTHQTKRCVCLVSVHLGNQAWICSSVCVRCPHDACAPTLRGSHVHCRSLTRMLRTRPAHSIRTHYSSNCIFFTGNAHHKNKWLFL